MNKRLQYFLSPDFYAQLKIFFTQLRPYKKHMTLSLVLSLTSNAFSLLPALITGYLIDNYLTGTAEVNNAENKVILLALGLFAIYTLSEILSIIQSQVQLRFSTALNHSLQNQLFEHVLHLPLKFFSNIIQN